MPKKPQSTRSGLVVTDNAELTLDDLCAACGLSREKIVTYVAEGIIEPAGSEIVQWRFSQTTLVQLHRAKRLEQDLGLNEAGTALAFDLLSQIEVLKCRLARFEEENSE
ncbi:MAG: MerR family transcriptional regulator [Rhizobiales bacterium]|nr:MerR family transcriptional regulator [Hyphomicrobiales bacterium]